nr:MBL fold metallo-hydrolase [Candidatus Sigynarchaeota archaeon]
MPAIAGIPAFLYSQVTGIDMEEIQLTWYGTANIKLEWNGTIIFFDPWFRRNENATPRIDTTLDAVDEGSIIFISHGHFDHFEDVPAIIRRKSRVDVYCSRVAKTTAITVLRKAGDLTDDQVCSVESKLHEIHAGDVIEFPDKDIRVHVIKSKHAIFDAKSIFRVLFNIKAWRCIKDLGNCLKNFPKGDVFGYDVHLGTKARVVMFGSLCARYPSILARHECPTVLLVACAGRFDSDKIGLHVASIIKPRYLIPIHQDDFYPPISYWCPVDMLKTGASKLDPPAIYMELEPGKPANIKV